MIPSLKQVSENFDANNETMAEATHPMLPNHKDAFREMLLGALMAITPPEEFHPLVERIAKRKLPRCTATKV